MCEATRARAPRRPRGRISRRPPVSHLARACALPAAFARAGFGSGFIATYCWRWTGERQSATYRKRFLRAIMRQDVGWHDARATTGLAATFAEATQLVEIGLGTKLSEGLRFIGALPSER
jgi:ABC-type multidrug transport system fused ATPase/permease subunit